MAQFWCEEAGLVEDPTRNGINPEMFMHELTDCCLTDAMMWDSRAAICFTKKICEHLKNEYYMYHPKVYGKFVSTINSSSFSSETFLGKFKTSKCDEDLHALSDKYGFLIIQLKEVDTLYNYVWLPYTSSIDGRGTFLSTMHNKGIVDKIFSDLEKNESIFNKMLGILVKYI